MNFYFVSLWEPVTLTDMGGGVGGNHLICSNLVTQCTTEALAVSTLCRTALKKNEQTQNNLENPLVILLVESVAKETSVIGDKEDHFFRNTKSEVKRSSWGDLKPKR